MQFPLAVNHFKQVLARDPDHVKAKAAWRVRAYVSVSLCKQSNSKPDSLTRALDDVLQRARDLEAKKQAGNEAFSARDYEQAAEMYSQALAIDPELGSFNSILYYNRGAARFQLGDYKGSYEDCTQAIDLNENYGKAYAKRAAAALKIEKVRERDCEREIVRQIARNCIECQWTDLARVGGGSVRGGCSRLHASI